MVIVMVVIVRVSVVGIQYCTHVLVLENFYGFLGPGHLRAATTSAGCTICSVLLDQLFLV